MEKINKIIITFFMLNGDEEGENEGDDTGTETGSDYGGPEAY